jgi:hypothetical protein
VAERRDAFLAGAAIAAALAASTTGAADAAAVSEIVRKAGGVRPLPTPPGRQRAATALSAALLSELVAGGVDLHRLSGKWLDWLANDGLDADQALLAGLEHLREFDAPVAHLPVRGPAPLAAVLPAALAAASPRAMVAGTFHTARLLDPELETGLCAVAIVVAGAVLLEGRRDVLPDVLAMLRANNAPSALYERVAAVPRDARQSPQVPRGLANPLDVTVWVLWQVHHRSRSVDVLEAMVLAGGIAPEVGAVLGALLGARDGMSTWPWR